MTLGSVALAETGNSSAPNSEWNTVAQTVGCGTGKHCFKLDCRDLTFVAGDEAQFQCMKAVPFNVLENAVISNNLGFSIVIDGEKVKVLERSFK